MARKLGGALLGYAAVLLLVQELGEPALSVAWSALSRFATLLVSAPAALLTWAVGAATDGDVLVDRTLPLLAIVAGATLAAVGRWLLRPLIDEHAPAENEPSSRVEPIDLAQRRRGSARRGTTRAA